MGDGFMDAARETRRYECFVRYLTEIHAFLLDNRPKANRSAVQKAAETSDRAHRRYGGQDTDAAACDALLDGLISGEESAWIQLLEWSDETDLYDAFHTMSPFRNRILLFGRTVHYGCGVDIDMRQLRRFIVQAAGSQDGLGEKFCVSLPFPEPGTVRVINKK